MVGSDNKRTLHYSGSVKAKKEGSPMTLIELPDDQAAVLKAKAQAQGYTLEDWLKKLAESETGVGAALDWASCPAVESVPGKVSGAWVFKDTRMPVSAVFENLEDGVSIDEIIELYDGLTREQVEAVLDFAVRSLTIPTTVAAQ
jgi:uncharacterized protein (DUF433 family)